MTTIDPGRAEAVAAVESAFRGLYAEFRTLYMRAAEVVSPGMLPGSFKTLLAIDRCGAISNTELAERIAADKGLVSRQVSELERLGLVERAADPADGRVRVISTTELGRERLAAARKPHEDAISNALSHWPVADIESFAALMHALVRSVAEHPESPDA